MRRICLAMPGAGEKISHGAPTFWAAKRIFAMFADAANQHGGGRRGVGCKATDVTQDLLVSRHPGRYFVPPYVGPSGWVAIYLDRRPDWKEVAERFADAFLLAAPTPRGRRAR